GAGVARAVRQFFPTPGKCVVYVGKGHNGGDALVAATQLAARGWKVELHLAFAESACSELTRNKLAALRSTGASQARTVNHGGSRTIILDGLLGVGAKPPLRDPIRGAAREINRRRHEQNAYV